MPKYKVLIHRAVFKNLQYIPEKDYQKLLKAIVNLESNPRPAGCRKLKGRPGYRIRQGNYRIIFDINDKVLIVNVLEAGDRKDVYE